MFNLETAIQSWKQSLKKSPAFEEGQIQEMETHLRDEIDQFITEGFNREEAFERAVAKFGSLDKVGDEVFKSQTTQKIDATPPWKKQSWLLSKLPYFLRITIRNFWCDKVHVGLNLIGLAIGFACILFIGLHIYQDLTYDTAYPEAGQIYRINVDVTGENRTDHFATSPPAVGPALKNTYPEVEQFARLLQADPAMVKSENAGFYETNILFADSTLFDIFKLPFYEGNATSALLFPHSAVISYEAAQKYYPGESALGKTLTFRGEYVYTITGVLAEKQPNMHLDLNIILPLRNFINANSIGLNQNWGSFAFYNYIHLAKGASLEELKAKIPDLVKRVAGSVKDKISLKLQPVQSIYLTPGLMAEIALTTDRIYLYILGISAFLVLVISTFNFLNLFTTQFIKRGNEMGIRKFLGANRFQLIARFLGISVFQSLLALGVAIILLVIFFQLFDNVLPPGLEFKLFSSSGYMLLMLSVLLSLSVGIIAGIGPSITFTGFETADIGKNSFDQAAKWEKIRNILVIAQCTITLVLLVGTFTVLNQVEYLQSKDLGFDKERVIVVPVNNREMRINFDTIQKELIDDSAIEGVTTAELALDGRYGTASFLAEGHPGENIRMRLYSVNYEFTNVLGLQLIEGRGFSRNDSLDIASSFIINETAARMLNWEAAALGKSLEPVSYKMKRGQVIGVVKDFHFTPLNEEVVPLVMYVSDTDMNFLYVKYVPGSGPKALNKIEKISSRYLSKTLFDYWFLDEHLDNQYQSEKQFSYLMRTLSVVAVVVACFGLLGLASLTVLRRRNEIGVRKVHGATMFGIVGMMATNFVKLVSISFLISIPVSYLFASIWLQNFAYRIDLTIGIFLFAGAIVLIISLLTISGKAIQVAKRNPVQGLRSG